MSMQSMDRLPSPPEGATRSRETYKPSTRITRTLRTAISPNLISLSKVSSSTVLRRILGLWVTQTSRVGDITFCRPTFTITAFGKPVSGAPVSLFLGDTRVGKTTTNENGEASFRLNFSSPGVHSYLAVIGETKPLFITGNPRAYSFKVSVWFVYTRSRNLTDIWARWQGRSFFRPLPVNFHREMPSSVIGLAGRDVGYVDLVPCIDGITIPMEIGVTAYCNTPERYPPEEKCCEYAKNTWWRLDVYATNDPKRVAATLQGANHIGGDEIHREYHLKYSITSNGVSFNGRFLKAIRCPWQSGTAPMDP